MGITWRMEDRIQRKGNRAMKVSELTGAELDYWVAKAEGHTELELVKSGERHFCEVVLPGEDGEEYWTEYKPSTDWERAGLIIERERISTEPMHHDIEPWIARIPRPNFPFKIHVYGPTPLIAAMRAYVALKFGDEVPAA